MPVAQFELPPDAKCRMMVYEDRATALAPQALGLAIPFEFSPDTGDTGLLKWDISYLYAELWSVREHGSRLVAPSLPEFVTDSHRAELLRFPLTSEALDLIEGLRRGGDLRLVLRIQATMVGTVHRDQIPDADRRRTLEALGLEHEIVGPVRRAQDLEITIPRWDWEEQVLPQWGEAAPVGSQELDIHALARSIQGASTGADMDALLEQLRAPIAGL